MAVNHTAAVTALVALAALIASGPRSVAADANSGGFLQTIDLSPGPDARSPSGSR